MQRSFNEDYTSVTACQRMIEAVDTIDSQFDHWSWKGTPPDRAVIAQAQQTFEERLAAQKVTATLAGEHEATEHLSQQWTPYKNLYASMLDPGISEQQRRQIYGHQLLDQSVAVHQAAENLIHMNLE